jgi:hypothetical protein
VTFGRALIGVIFACPKCSSVYVVMQERRPDRPDLLDANVAGFFKCDSHNTCARYMREPLKGVLTKDLDSTAMVRDRDDWGYYVRAIRDLTHPPSWRCRIIRRGNPMGVLLEAEGFSSYEAARFAGNVALADFLEQLEREKLRNEYEKRSARLFRDRD